MFCCARQLAANEKNALWFTVDAITQADVDVLTNEIALISARLLAGEHFYLEYPQASAVLPPIFALETDGHVINNISVSGGNVSLNGQSSDFENLADDVVELRDNDLFTHANVGSASSYQQTDELFTYRNETVVDFDISMNLQAGTGVR